MTDEPRHDYQDLPGHAAEGDTPPAHAEEVWAAHPETAEHPDQADAKAEPVNGSRIWPRIIGVLLLFVIAGGVWSWQNPTFVQSSLRWLWPSTRWPGQRRNRWQRARGPGRAAGTESAIWAAVSDPTRGCVRGAAAQYRANCAGCFGRSPSVAGTAGCH